MRKNGQAMPLEEYTEVVIRRMCKKWYRRGYQDGQKAKERELNPNKHYCRECKWLCGDSCSIGIRCMNKNRKRAYHVNTSDSSNYKVPSTLACKSGFEPKEEEK